MRYRIVAVASLVMASLPASACHLLRLGEPAGRAGSTAAEERAEWNRSIAEIISMYDRVPGVQQVIAGGDSVRVYLDNDAAVPIVARVLNAAGPAVQLYIIAPEPGRVALGATAAGFPPEHIIAIETGDRIILRAMRGLPAPRVQPASPAQSSPRQ